MLALYKFELRKIISRKIVWITGCVMLAGLLIWGVASAVLPENRESDHFMYPYGQEKTICRKNLCRIDSWYRFYDASLSVNDCDCCFSLWI